MKYPASALAAIIVMTASTLAEEAIFDLTLRREGKSWAEQWKPSETAVIVCDMWDSHHSQNAVKRVGEIAPRMNEVLKNARQRGALIIHAPSSCMEFYKDHPARKRAQATPKASSVPAGIEQWLHWINEDEKKAGYPIDHADGGEDDDPADQVKWHEQLRGMGRNPGSPWVRQVDLLEIDEERDTITDDGVENWSLLEQRGIKNVLVMGVHTNMCVLGRPFGLRQLAKNGKNVVLARDMTDTMYNPASAPQVSHFRGTDLIIGHVERFVCPTISSDQILGGQAFRFSGDQRPHLVMILAEEEYETGKTVPAFAEAQLGSDFRLSTIREDAADKNKFPGLEAIKDAEVLFLSVRRRVPTEAQMQWLKNFVAAGKPVVGIRTASHAFSLRGKPAAPGQATWESFDPEVFGGHYRGHTGKELPTFAWIDQGARQHPILRGVASDEFSTGGSLYQVSPLEAGVQPLLMGRAGDLTPHEPVAWTFRTKAGGRVFYTSLGHPKDFEAPAFRQMLRNALHWVVGKEVPEKGVPLRAAK